MVKVEVEPFLNLPNEVIYVDDDVDDVNVMEISYLPKLLARLDKINPAKQRLAALLQNNMPTDTVDLVCDDSDAEENAETVRHW